MKKITIITALLVGFFVNSVYAGEFGEIKKKITDVRTAMVTMIENKDKRGADQQKIANDATDAATALLSKTKAPAGKAVQFKELVDAWNAFKKTRKDEVIPNLIAGKDTEVKAIVGGIQKERFQKMMGLCDELDK